LNNAIIFGSVAGAMIAWAAAEWWRGVPRQTARARLAWTLGALLMTVHSVAAFVILYGGSHTAAVAATARQTAALTGIASGAGIYLNYFFLEVWIADALWWWIAADSYAARPRGITIAISAFFLFMFINGGVIFADGLMRVIGSVAVVIAAAAWMLRRRS
jgi:hypothetical protein